MGARNSQTSKYEQYSNAVSNVSASVVARVTNSTNISQYAFADVEVVTINSWLICPAQLKLTADAKVVARTVVENQTELKADLALEIMNKLKAEIEQDQSAENQFLSMGSNTQVNETTVWTNFENSITAAVSQSIDNSFSQDQTAGGSIKHTIIDSVVFGGQCVYNAKSLIEAVTTNVTKSVMEVLVDAGVVNDIDIQAKMRQSAKNAGLDLSFMFMFLMLAAVIVLMIVGGASQNKWLMVLLVGVLILWWFFW